MDKIQDVVSFDGCGNIETSKQHSLAICPSLPHL